MKWRSRADLYYIANIGTNFLFTWTWSKNRKTLKWMSGSRLINVQLWRISFHSQQQHVFSPHSSCVNCTQNKSLYGVGVQPQSQLIFILKLSFPHAVVFSLSQARIFWHFSAMMSHCDNAFWLVYRPWLSSPPVGIIFTQLLCIFFKFWFFSVWTSNYVLTLKNRCSHVTLSCRFSRWTLSLRMTAIHLQMLLCYWE